MTIFIPKNAHKYNSQFGIEPPKAQLGVDALRLLYVIEGSGRQNWLISSLDVRMTLL